MFHKRGFTLIELLIVVIIIGVLASLAIPRYTGFIEKARAAEALAMIDALKSGETAYKTENGSYSGTIGDLNIENANTTEASATAAGQMWYYSAAIGVSYGGITQDYRIRAARADNKGAGGTAGYAGKTVDFYWSDASGARWGEISGTYGHPGTPKS